MPIAKKLDTGVYQILNLVNGKRYVGSAAISFVKRWRDHKWSLKKNKHHSKHLQRAWNRYGEENFEFEILGCCNPKDCILWEQKFIDKYKTANRKFGYNIYPIAGSPLGNKLSKETKAKMGNARRGIPRTEEVRTKISKALKGFKVSEETKEKIRKASTGKRHSEETKRKMTESHRGKKLSEEHKMKLSKFQSGRKRGPNSEETKKKRSLSLRRYWAARRAEQKNAF
jgi:group I intron endonuclease